MRLLFASTAGAGHFGPLVPWIDGALERGHEVLVAAYPNWQSWRRAATPSTLVIGRIRRSAPPSCGG